MVSPVAHTHTRTHTHTHAHAHAHTHTPTHTHFFSPSSSADLHAIKDPETGTDGIYWCVDYPWPMSDRDVSYNISTGRFRLGGALELEGWKEGYIVRSHNEHLLGVSECLPPRKNWF